MKSSVIAGPPRKKKSGPVLKKKKQHRPHLLGDEGIKIVTRRTFRILGSTTQISRAVLPGAMSSRPMTLALGNSVPFSPPWAS